MQTIQIDNQEIENFIKSKYGNDTKTLKDVKRGIEPLYDDSQYQKRMNNFKAM